MRMLHDAEVDISTNLPNFVQKGQLWVNFCNSLTKTPCTASFGHLGTLGALGALFYNIVLWEHREHRKHQHWRTGSFRSGRRVYSHWHWRFSGSSTRTTPFTALLRIPW